jgi:uncharacterized protein (DUF1800 family)
MKTKNMNRIIVGLTLLPFSLPATFACSTLPGLEKVISRSKASGGDILVASMNRLGYGVHARSTLNTRSINDLESAFGRQKMASALAKELRSSFSDLKKTNRLPFRKLALHHTNFPSYGPYVIKNVTETQAERSRFIADHADQFTNPLNQYRAHNRLTQTNRMIAEAINIPNYNIPSIINRFWFDHFNVDAMKTREHSMDYELALRNTACKSFYEMLLVSAKHPAMIVYLDNIQNKKDALNENYAREVIELHTIGSGPIDVNQKRVYTEAEILEAAKVLSGWHYSWSNSSFNFRNALHDNSTKTFPTLFKGKSFAPGLAGSEAFLKALASHPRTKRHICRKLAIELYGFHPGAKVVNACVNVYGETGHLPKMYEALLTHPEFWNHKNFLRGTKMPLEALVSSARGLGYVVGTNLESKRLMQNINRYSTNLGQPLITVAEPTGLDNYKRSDIAASFLSNRFDSINTFNSQTNLVFKGKRNQSLEDWFAQFQSRSGDSVTFDLIVRDVAPVFHSSVRTTKPDYRSVSSKVDKLEKKDQLLKTSLVRLLSNGYFLKK